MNPIKKKKKTHHCDDPRSPPDPRLAPLLLFPEGGLTRVGGRGGDFTMALRRVPITNLTPGSEEEEEEFLRISSFTLLLSRMVSEFARCL